VLAAVAVLVLREDPQPSLEQQMTVSRHQVFRDVVVHKPLEVLEVV
jgi:hypothetical protein